jgi:hypothetical protein
VAGVAILVALNLDRKAGAIILGGSYASPAP